MGVGLFREGDYDHYFFSVLVGFLVFAMVIIYSKFAI